MALLQMEWSRPKQQGVTPGPRAGHAGVTVGENWFIAGGGDNKNGMCTKLYLLLQLGLGGILWRYFICANCIWIS